jgi:TonB family protein
MVFQMAKIQLSLAVTALAAGLTAPPLWSQTLPGVKPEQMGKIESKAYPEYPAAAKQNGVQGNLLLAVTVSPKGGVDNVQLLAGPAELAGAAAAAVRQWKYQPYMLEGIPTAVQTTAFVMFRLENRAEPADNMPELKTLADLYPVHEQCRYLIEKGNIEEALETCKESADMSEHLPPQQYAAYHIFCWDEYAVLLLKQNRAADALTAFDKECDYAGRLLKSDDKSYGIAFWHRALAHQTLHDNAAADADFAVAEKSLSAAKSGSQDEVTRRNAELALNKVLRQHASLLDSEGQHVDAERLRIQVTP